MASLERRVAIDAARAAGQLLKSELAGSRRIAYKGSPTNLVTEMDARRIARVRVGPALPDAGTDPGAGTAEEAEPAPPA